MNIDEKNEEILEMESNVRNYGFVPSVIDDTQYTLGGTELPKVVQREDGEWGQSLPLGEKQVLVNGEDTFGCTIYGTQNAEEIMIKEISGKEVNMDESYLYNLAMIVPPGADPHFVAEMRRKNGAIIQRRTYQTLKDFMTPRPVTKELLDEGSKWGWDFKHQWLWSSSIDTNKRTELIREYLRYSVLGAAVTAWIKQGDVYIDNGQPNTHWAVLSGEEKGKGWKIYDSYEPSVIKILSYNHDISRCKRYQLIPKEVSVQVSWLQKLLNALKEALYLIVSNRPTPEPIMPSVVPSTVPVVVSPDVSKEANVSMLEKFCIAIREKEGWYSGSRSWRNNNPGNVRYSSIGYALIYGEVGEDRKGVLPDKRGFAVFSSVGLGMLYLQNYVKSIIAGKSGQFNTQAKKMFNLSPEQMGDLTITQFFKIYAPSTDNNDPVSYALFVSQKLSVGTFYQIKNLIV